jgi:cobaltochelatase CobN
MLMTSKQLGGNPEGLVTDMRNQNNIVTRDYRDELKLELNSQLLNPAYQNSLLGTPSGWNEYSARYADLFAFSATNPDSVSQSTWTQVSQNLLDISKSTGLSKDYQGYAMQSMLGWSIEAARRGMWQPSSQMLQDLVDTYITETVKYGPVCCHHTCAALSFNNFVVVSSSLSSQQLQQFAEVMQAATGMSITVGSTGTPTQQASAASASSASGSSGASSAGDQPVMTDSGDQSSPTSESAGTDGSSKAYEVSRNSSSSSGQSSMPIVAIVGVLILVGLVGAGYFRSNILGFFKK